MNEFDLVYTAKPLHSTAQGRVEDAHPGGLAELRAYAEGVIQVLAADHRVWIRMFSHCETPSGNAVADFLDRISHVFFVAGVARLQAAILRARILANPATKNPLRRSPSGYCLNGIGTQGAPLDPGLWNVTPSR